MYVCNLFNFFQIGVSFRSDWMKLKQRINSIPNENEARINIFNDRCTEVYVFGRRYMYDCYLIINLFQIGVSCASPILTKFKS